MTPSWLPEAARLYLDHIEQGLSLRALARREGCHASTVMRQVRRYESLRDDPLVDEALGQLGLRERIKKGQEAATKAPDPNGKALPEDKILRQEAVRVLRYLLREGAFLAIAADMDKAMVIRQVPDGPVEQLAKVDRTVAQAFALQDWIRCQKSGRVSTYILSTAGRQMLRRMTKEIGAVLDVSEEDGPRRNRYGLAESPVAVLGRRRDKDGKPFLDQALIQMAERIHEDFELAQIGSDWSVKDWEDLLNTKKLAAVEGPLKLADRARQRVARALQDLGPGLGDVVLRCCCYHEGLEAAEQRMGWAARSGKIVLRIALQRLRRHFDETYGASGPMIG